MMGVVKFARYDTQFISLYDKIKLELIKNFNASSISNGLDLGESISPFPVITSESFSCKLPCGGMIKNQQALFRKEDIIFLLPFCELTFF